MILQFFKVACPWLLTLAAGFACYLGHFYMALGLLVVNFLFCILDELQQINKNLQISRVKV